MSRLSRFARSPRTTLAVRPLEDRTLPSSVQGAVFDDANQNQAFDPGETSLPGWTVYVDNNQDGILNPGEASAVTDAAGNYLIDTTAVVPGGNGRNYLSLDLQVGSGGRWLPSTPTVTSAHPVNEPVALRDFGVRFHPYEGVQPVGPETPVNVAMAGGQSSPSVAADAAGNYVVTWTTPVGGVNTVVARAFNADGSPRSGEFTVGTGWFSRIAMADDGRFVVAWALWSPTHSTNSVLARLYDANATPATGVITVAAAGTSKNWIGNVAMDSAGRFAVLYETYKSGVHGADIVVQRYTAGGGKDGKPIKAVVGTAIWGNSKQTIAMDATGRFVVAWDDLTTINGVDSTVVFAQKFSAAGLKVGAQITVASSPSNRTLWQSNVSMNAAGRFVVTWGESLPSLIKAQVYDWATPVGGNLTLFSGPSWVSVGTSIDDANNVTFAWGSAEIRFRRLTGTGVFEQESIVNTTTQGLQGDSNAGSWEVGVAATGANRFVVVWPGYGPGDDAGIFAQRFGPVPAPLAATRPAASSMLVPAVMIDENDDVW